MTQPWREQAVSLFRDGVAAVGPERLVRAALKVRRDTLELHLTGGVQVVPLPPGGRLRVLAVGKAAAPMAGAAAEILGERIGRGMVVTKDGFARHDLLWPQHECGHPVPDERGLAAAGAAEYLVRGLSADDVVLVLVSGGASALLPAPVEGVSLEDKQALLTRLLRADVDIHTLNRIRKALSRLKGGGLARLAAPARVVGLYLSDVPGNALGSIGSGPTVLETPDRPGVAALLRERGLWVDVPRGIQQLLAAPAPPPADPPVPPLNGLIGTNAHLLDAIAQAAWAAGITPIVNAAPLTGNVRQAVATLREDWARTVADIPPGEPIALLRGGEITVTVTGSGLGGRCQELAARMLPHMAGDAAFLAAGSDGNDGPTDAAGGVVDAESWAAIGARGLSYDALLADNDSYALLARSGNLIRIPPTQHNLMDVYLFTGPAAPLAATPAPHSEGKPMTGEEFKAALREGRRVYGTMLMRRKVGEVDEALRALSLDFIIVDNEHAPFSRGETAQWLRQLRKWGVMPFVRVPIPASHYVTMALDAGAQGILAPYVETVAEVQELVGAAKWLPLKGEAVRRAVEQGEFPSEATREHLARRNRNNVLVIGVESVVAMERLDALLGVPGVDAVFVGPNDLSIQLGIPDQYDHPDFTAAVARIHDTCLAHGVPLVMHQFSSAMARPWIERGVNFVLCGTDRADIAEGLAPEFQKLRAI